MLLRCLISSPADRCKGSRSRAHSCTILVILIADGTDRQSRYGQRGYGSPSLIRRAADERGAAVVVATHSPEAAAIADVQIRMRDGKIA